MKILQLRLQNLNSLVGQWHIDLTDPAFISDGIFAITGATGAGKSTILDAICLGLYGRTPRLAKISTSTNEIMARGTGECWAEVTFATPAGAYRSHWSQRRARGAVDGQLQPPQHEVAEVSSQKILAAKLKDTEQLIGQLAGMDYDQFTRSMLLAQGHFASFLRAKPRERMPILEQITGTSLYSEISIAAHERCAHEKTELDGRKAQVEQSAPLLSEAELASLRQRQESLSTEIQHVQDLEKSLGALLLLQQRTENSEQAHIQLKEAIHQHKIELKNWQSTELDQASSVLKDATTSMDAAELRLQESQITYQAARELNTKIQAGAAAVRELETDAATLQLAQEQQRQELAVLAKDLAASQADLAAAAAALQAVAGDAQLVRDGSGLLVELGNLRLASAAATSSHKRRQEGLTELKEQQMKADKMRQAITPLQRQQKQLEADIQAKNKERQVLLDGHKISVLRSEHQQLRDQLEALSRWNAGQAELDQLARTREHVLAQIRSGGATLQQLKQQLSAIQTRQREHQVKLKELDEYLHHHDKVLSLAEQRQLLRPHEPCPLCGAKEHPFLQHEPAPDQQLQARRARYEQQLADITADLNAEQLAVAGQHGRNEQLAARSKQLADTHTELAAQLAAVAGQFIQPGTKDPHQLQQQLETQLDSAASKLGQLESLSEVLDELRATQVSLSGDVHKHQRQLQLAEHTIQDLQAGRERVQQQCKQLQQQVQEATAQLGNRLKAYGITLEAANDLDQISTELERRSSTWQERQRQHSEGAQTVAALTTAHSHLQAKLADQQAELDKLKGRLVEKSAEITTWQQEKLALWQPDDSDSDGDDDIAAEFQRLKQSKNAAKQAWEAAHAAMRKAESTHTQHLSQLSELTKQLRNLEQTRHEQATELQQTWIELRQHLRRLGEFIAEPDTDKDEGLAPLMQWCGGTVTELGELPPAELLRASQAQLEQRMLALAEIRGSIRVQLDEHAQNYQRHCQQQAELTQQQLEYQKWLSLSELIGHSKGTKYRNFAQGITLERLISCANMQLAAMSDRYVLIQDSHDPLELSVRDHYQAGEMRSVKNLSGGESFLVSLALALGLSHLASHNTQVDSLFLDEGFGTLDEDTLEVALDALSQLRRHDKMIGIISHVHGLKERIPAKIQVHKVPGGRSVLRGPGCSRID